MKLSKSKLALAKVINGNGGWPSDEANFAAQDKIDGESNDNTVSFYSGKVKPTRRADCSMWRCEDAGSYFMGYEKTIKRCKLLPNWHQTILCREEYHHAYPKADADGWIEWKGGECPVDNDSLVDVKFPDGSEYFNTDAYGDWSSESDTPISHYRQSKKVVKPCICESVTSSIPEPESKPTIEQLAQDYRNKLDFAKRKQQEADDAKAAADAALGELERAGEEIGLLLSPIREGKKPEINIIDWRDLMVGDEIICSEDGNWNCDLAGNVCVVREIESQEYTGCMPILAEYCDASYWGDKFTFVRRP